MTAFGVRRVVATITVVVLVGRGVIMSLRELDFVNAARSLGARDPRMRNT